MEQVGRNDPCTCGSGKKYKKCCRTKDEEVARRHLHAVHEQERRLEKEMRDLAERRAAQEASERAAVQAWKDALVSHDDLDDLSNSVLDLIAERRYDEALAACDRLLREYPEVHDGFERSALVHDALGNHSIAADFWQKAVDFVEHPDRRDGYDEELIEDYRQHMHRARERAAAGLPAQPADQDRAP